MSYKTELFLNLDFVKTINLNNYEEKIQLIGEIQTII